MSEAEIVESVKDLKEEEKESLAKKLSKELYLKNNRKGVFDAVQEKIVSRKLLVFMTSTALLIWAGLDPETWGLIATMYIGGQSVIDVAKAWRHGA
jgi:hypothetical protein